MKKAIITMLAGVLSVTLLPGFANATESTSADQCQNSPLNQNLNANRHELTVSDIEKMNAVMSENNRELLPEEAFELVATDEGKVEVLDISGNPIPWSAA